MLVNHPSIDLIFGLKQLQIIPIQEKFLHINLTGGLKVFGQNSWLFFVRLMHSKWVRSNELESEFYDLSEYIIRIFLTCGYWARCESSKSSKNPFWTEKPQTEFISDVLQNFIEHTKWCRKYFSTKIYIWIKFPANSYEAVKVSLKPTTRKIAIFSVFTFSVQNDASSQSCNL